MSSLESELNGRFLLHAVQLLPLSSFKEQEFFQFFSLAALGEKTLSFAVKVTFILPYLKLVPTSWLEKQITQKETQLTYDNRR